MEFQGNAVHVLAARDRRDPRRAVHCLGDFHRDPDDHPDPDGHNQVAGKKTGLAGEITELADPASHLLLSASPVWILAKLPFHFLL